VIYRAKDGSESELSARRSKKHTDGIVIRLRKDGYDIPIEVTRDQAKHLVDELIAAEVSLAEGTAAQKKARTPKRREARDPLAPSLNPVMCKACGYRNQVRGEWRDNVFYPASDKCPRCEAKEQAAGKEQC
jgi:hypothetical protein